MKKHPPSWSIVGLVLSLLATTHPSVGDESVAPPEWQDGWTWQAKVEFLHAATQDRTADALPLLKFAFGDNHFAVRNEALVLLAKDERVDKLAYAKLALADNSAYVRSRAIRIVAASGADEQAFWREILAAPPLSLKTHTVISHVGTVFPADFATEIRKAAESESPVDRAASAGGIARLGTPDDIALLKTLASDKASQVRDAAADACRHLHTQPDIAVSVLNELLRDPDRAIQRTSIISLGEIDSTDTVEPLMGVIENNMNAYLRRLAVQSLPAKLDDATRRKLQMISDQSRDAKLEVAVEALLRTTDL